MKDPDGLRDLIPACLSGSSCHCPHCTYSSRKTASLGPSKCPLGLCVFAPVIPFACLSTQQIPGYWPSLSSLATSSVKLSLISPGRCSSLFQVPTALCKYLHGSTLLYCIVNLFACLFLLLDCKHRESRNCIFSS